MAKKSKKKSDETIIEATTPTGVLIGHDKDGNSVYGEVIDGNAIRFFSYSEFGELLGAIAPSTIVRNPLIINPDHTYNPQMNEILDLVDPVDATQIMNPRMSQIMNNVDYVSRNLHDFSVDITYRLDTEHYTKAQTDQRIFDDIHAHDVNLAAHGYLIGQLTSLASRVHNLEMALTGISTNLFSITFETLDGLEVSGVWNRGQGRIEF